MQITTYFRPADHVADNGKLALVMPSWPLLTACVILLGSVAVLFRASLELTGGHLVYTLDDPYIHMAMARSFAEHGVWGITAHGFTSSTSSPIWTFIIAAAFRILGVHDWIPLALNVILGLALMVTAHLILKHYEISGISSLISLTAIIVFATVPALVFTGMEHVLQLIIVLLFSHQIVLLLTSSSAQARINRFVLISCAAMLPLIRYEGLFVIAAAVLLCLSRRQWKDSLVILASALIGVGLYGAWSVAHGWYWLPNSLIVKSHVDPANAMTGMFHTASLIGQRLVTAIHLTQLMVLSAAILLYRWRKKETSASDSV